MDIGNISSMLEEIKLGTLARSGHLGERAVEIVDLFEKTCTVGAIRKKTPAVDDGEERVEDTPVRFAIRLKMGIAKIEAFVEVGAHLLGWEPLVVVLAKVGIAGIAFDAGMTFQSPLHQIENGVFQFPGSYYFKR